MLNDRAVATILIDAVQVAACRESVVFGSIRRQLEIRPRGRLLAVGSANLDHLHHFARRSPTREPHVIGAGDVDWVLLADGAPIVRRARKLTGVHWPRLTGADLLAPILAIAEQQGSSVGFLGGRADVHEALAEQLGQRFPGLTDVRFWAPERAELEDPERAATLAAAVRGAGVELLVVGLGKPRQELWIDRYGTASGARVALAFGAAADFLAGAASRAPKPMQDLGIEWLYRLAMEPRRMANRYLVQGPPAWLVARRARLASEHSAFVSVGL
ncbi:WecB/TagA/CpsF family glycosyltransferase [Aldersonia sp. NBC_00410]|nr:WecB/TagA/CpsF family glycosyltransferase [Aldersonia sp. NBC_00410]